MAKKIEKGFLMKLKNMLLHLESVRTVDGVDLMVDGDVEVGNDVMVADDNGDWTPAPSGEYDCGDRILVVEAGRLTEIREVATDPEPEPEPEPEQDNKSQRFSKMKEFFEQTYEERIKKIVEAIVSLGYSEYGYVVEASDEHAVWCYWDEVTGEHYIRFTLTWADGFVTASDPVEVVPSFKPKDEPAPTIVDELRAEIDRLKSEKAALEEQVGRMAAVPPVGEQGGTVEQPLANKFIENARKRQ